MPRKSPPTPLKFYLLGSFRIEYEMSPIVLPTRKVQSLLAYLALHPEEHSREKLAALLWGDSPDTQARNSLRTALKHLRKVLGAELLLADSETIQINPTFRLWLDAREFEQVESAASISHLRSAISHYHGDLLADFYDDWIYPERERYRELYLHALLQLTQAYRAASEYARAMESARQVLAADPANERAHQHLMFCNLALGDRGAALKQYDTCLRALQTELAVEPSRETTALYEWIRLYEGAQRASERPALAAQITNLPIPLSSFIGRKKELAELKELITTTRLLTLTGAGGSGKTRLVIQMATDLIDQFHDGVWWVDLASLMDDALVVHAVAQALGVREEANQALLETLVDFLRDKHLFLVLDNCEQLVTACAQLAHGLLTYCANLRIVATSREALGITGETVYQVPTLALPAPQRLTLTDLLLEYESIRLFVERARAVKFDFELSEQNAVAVLEICQRLDGIPLALELAAARIKFLTAEQIAERLNDRFSLLTQGSRTALPRQQTLRATIDWSYDLLPAEARLLFQRLSVFAGGFTLEAAEAICSLDSLTSGAVSGLLGRLVDRSLVKTEHQGDHTRYRLLDTICEYAHEKLDVSGELATLCSRHLQFYLNLVEMAEARLLGPQQMVWLNRLEAENENLRAALQWGSSQEQHIEEIMRLAGALWRFWWMRGRLSEGRGYLMRILSQSKESTPSIWRAKALRAAGDLAYFQGACVEARELYQAGLTIARPLGENRSIANSLNGLGNVAFSYGEYDDAQALYQESLTLRRQLGDRWGIANSLCNLAGVARVRGNYAAARAMFEECLGINKDLGDRRGIAFILGNLGEVILAQGDSEKAQSLQEQSLALFQELDDQWGIAYGFDRLGDIERYIGNYDRASFYYKKSLILLQELGDMTAIVYSLEALAMIALAQRHPLRAASLFGASETLCERLDLQLSPTERAEYEQNIAMVRMQLDKETFSVAWQAGRVQSLEQAIEYALETTPSQEC